MGTTKAPRKPPVRRPMNKYIAAERISRILSDLPEAERPKVLEFVATPRQIDIPGTGNA